MKYVFVFISIVFISLKVSAQLYSFGIKAGLSLPTTIVKKSDADYSIYPGMLAGVSMKAAFDNFYIRPSILFTQKGSIESYKENEVKIRYNYFDFPVLIGFQDNITSKISYFIELGAYVGLCINHEYKEETEFRVMEYDTYNGMDLNDVGLDAGIGIQLSNTELAVNFLRGFGTVINPKNIYDLKVYNQVFTISLLFNFSPF